MTFLFLVACAVAAYFYFGKAKAIREIEGAKQRSDAAQAKCTEVEKEIESLSKYRAIADAESHAALLKTQAEAAATEITDRAEAEIKTLREQSQNTLAAADRRAAEVIAKAEEDAKRIAGDAYEAMKKADSLQKTANALKNIIEGYGDQYIVPTQSLIDRLGEDYSHTQAGEELKRAREHTRRMIKEKSAAACDYVEENRKTTAIDFVTDAFNGKVDSVLATVREDNFGTLEQKVKDAFQTVNHNGKAFREARITDAFLQSRLNELRWACSVQAIKEKDREEQRAIREQIREEEKAVRDFERAMKEAQKEEGLLTKAMEKVRKEMESANEQQKAKYEEKLKEMQQKLTEEQEKNQRALSMAQQTRSGHVYVISNIGSFGEEVVKIGLTRRLDPMDRVWELGDASVPFDFDVHAMIHSEDAPSLEKALHAKFCETKLNRVNPRKEYFKVSLVEIRQELERLNIKAQWTLTAEAKEYRESL
ncbi:MAG: DUF4041 domain-containing protein, partial [Bdellovibrionota bacterium]